MTRRGITEGHLSPSFLLGLLVVLIVAICSLDATRAAAVWTMLGMVLAAILWARVPLHTLARRLAPLLSFSVLALGLALLAPVEEGAPTVTLPLLSREVSAYTWGFLVSLWLKSALVVMAVTAWGQVMSERDLLEGLLGLHLPSKLTALCYLMVRGVRSVGVETQRLLRSRDARGRARGLRGLRVAAAMAQMLMVRLGRRAETQALALVARGYDGQLALPNVRGISVPEGLVLGAGIVVLIWITHL